ncbi:M24 family metallopeptidase [Companilactobacillus mishanensis]|uniref:Aminopeptidase P family protein n=1 Tax=Companilactobacillus mishanensis TaxID=2486008 RepID=A0A5P0ZIM9_9LACO|nr:Xaa-Pro peptidase family protein [Companilactobacillus mishanensis]MQS44772.1 aminopeptidase P family protein [Companilactobacillus mishanensis]MQS52888.1 aminopeptidase P family protein [Companilactobacillus mishanensis]
MKSQLLDLQKYLGENNYDIAYISDPTDIDYFTGFYSDPIERILALLVFPDKDPFIFAPQLEVESVKKAGWDKDVFGYLDNEDAFKLIAGHILDVTKSAPKVWASEKDNLSVQKLEAIKQNFPDAEFPGNLSRYMEKARLIKTPEEIKLLEAAGDEADYAFTVGFNAIKEGRTEQEVVAEIEYAMMKKGVMHMSFDTIVQAGENAANPHGGPEKNPIHKDELVLFDLGTVHQRYISDASRTVAFGKPSDKALDIYKVDLEAQYAAMDAAKPGITAAELDKVARDVIDKAGYGEYFIHRLGHGIGTSEHEFPSIMEGNDLVLEPGMCFSIEPGIYIPHVAGVRIEDCVHITENGNEPFTHTSKELKYID